MSGRSGRTALTAARKPCSMESMASANPSELLCRLKKTSANSMLRVSAIFHHGTDSTDAPLANSNLTISICLLRTASPSARLNARGYSSRQFPAPSNISNIENCRLFTATERSESRLDSGLHIGWPFSNHRRRKSELPDSTASLRGSSLASYCVVGIRIICSTSSSHSRRLGVSATRHANRILLSIMNFMAYRPLTSLPTSSILETSSFVHATASSTDGSTDEASTIVANASSYVFRQPSPATIFGAHACFRR